MPDVNQTQIENIQGFRTIDVRHVDGVRESVQIKKLNVYQLFEWSKSFGDQGKMVEIFTGRERQWVETIEYDGPNGIEGILETGEAINLPLLVKFAAKDTSLTTQAGRFLQEKVDVLNALSASARSQTKSLSS